MSARPDDFRTTPVGLPVPVDDGAADHLAGMAMPPVRLPSTLGGEVDLSDAGDLLVVYVYPRTGQPGQPLLAGWDAIPGARGCTPQSCAFRDLTAAFAEHGARVFGVSAQSPEDQREFAEREHIPYPLLSDAELRLAATELRLPTFTAAGLRLYRRLTLVVRDGRVAKAFYPVFPPERNAGDVLAWLGADDD